MALMDFIKKQFIDVIHWTEESEGVLATRYPMRDFEIQYGAQLTVRESQAAIFVNEGKLADVFMPGQYKLTTQTLPVLTYLQNWDKLFQSPFKSDVYFFSTRLQLDRKWGTPNAITIRDADFGMVRLRAFGIYSYKIVDPALFYKEVSGTRESYTVEDLDGQLRNTLVGAITDLFASSGVAFVDMAGNQDEFGKRIKEKAQGLFTRYGLELDSLVVQNISLPEELQKTLDQRISMGMVGDLNRYTQYQIANAIPLAAQNEGGLAGIGAGLGVGLGMGQNMAQTMGQAWQGGTVAVQEQGVEPPAISAGSQPLTPSVAPSTDEVMATIEKLHALMQKQIISTSEFEQKKAELLGRL